MLSFAILFFFLNHAIESSVIGLELIYEHRNYLPSLFLFAPVAISLQRLIDHYRAQGSTFHRVVTLFVLLLIMCFGAGTYIRNLAWLDPKTFWEDAAHKAPLSMRPLHNLAYYHYEKRGDYKKAYELYQKELGLRSYNRQELSSAHVNLANYYYRLGEFSQASEHLSQAHAALPGFELVRYLQALVLFKAGQAEKALDILRPLVAERRNSFDAHYLMAQILLQTGNQEDAIVHLQYCLSVLPDSARAQILVGIALSLEGKKEGAERFLGLALNRSPGDKQALLWMIDCQLQRSEKAAAAYASRFLEGVPTDQIEGTLRKALDDNLMPVDSRERLSRWIWVHAHEQAFRILEPFSGIVPTELKGIELEMSFRACLQNTGCAISDSRNKEQVKLLPFGIYFGTILCLCLAGLLLSIYLAVSHHRVHTDMGFQSFCALSKSINCDTVSQSPYSILGPLPVAVWGVAGYGFFLLLLVFTAFPSAGRRRVWALCLATAIIFSIGSTAFAAISSFLIGSYCILCIATYAINFLLVYFTWIIRHRFHVGRLRTGLRPGSAVSLAEANDSACRLFTAFALGMLGDLFLSRRIGRSTSPAASTPIRTGITDEGTRGSVRKSRCSTSWSSRDYQCFQCRKMHYYLRELVARHPDKIRLTHCNFPMDHEFNPIVDGAFSCGLGPNGAAGHPCGGER